MLYSKGKTVREAVAPFTGAWIETIMQGSAS